MEIVFPEGVTLWKVQVLGSVMELGIRDNRLRMREYGGTLKWGHLVLMNWSSAVRGIGEGDRI
eukprot:1153084-Pelagomonas_calceolata.AAC.8